MNILLRNLFLLACFAMIVLPSCGGSSDDSPTPEEENLVISTSPLLNGQTEGQAPGPNFSLTVNLTSKMPPQGVKIDVSAKPDGQGTTAFFTTNQNTSSATTTFSITNTPQLTVCRVTVTVTSLSKPTNTVTGFYLYSRK